MIDASQTKGGTMRKTFWSLLAASAVALALAAALPAATIGHDHFVSDPYPDSWCDLAGTSVDQVVANYTTADESRASINVLTTFTVTATGKRLEIRSTGVRKESPPVDNGDGTYSLIFTNVGQSPKFKLPNGPVIGLDVGLIVFDVTFDAATGDFISFSVLRVEGQRPGLGSEICAALT
jgi:hypothetical protein